MNLESGIHGVESRIQNCAEFPYMGRAIDEIVACVAGVQKRRGRELGGDTAREGVGERLQASHCFSIPPTNLKK